ncbi:hypothetical protein IQ225_06265 [Synechocystis salina LEGE 06155]|nr:hypothetical protein [Synechocystis salina LEGE 06155]
MTTEAFRKSHKRRFLPYFWVVAAGLVVFELFSYPTNSFLSNITAVAITIAALIPSYLWCSGLALGIPIFPLCSLTYVWTFSLPLVSDHPLVGTYSPEAHLRAGLVVISFLLVGTMVWFPLVKNPPRPKITYRGFPNQRGNVLFLSLLGFYALFAIANNGGWLFWLEEGWFTAVRAGILGLNTLASFVIAYRLGTRNLSPRQSQLAIVLLSFNIIASAVGLLLVGAASTFLLATVAYTIGRKKIPVLMMIIFITCFAILHFGKAEMRAKYWWQPTGVSVQVSQYPAWFSEWAGYSVNYLSGLNSESSLTQSRGGDRQSILERSSLIHLLLMVQAKSPGQIPFLNGYTYEIIPELLVPRIFSPNKIASHEGTYRLNIHYGRQTRADTSTTTIGWGLLNESYANYGWGGSTALGIILGAIYGWLTRLSINLPILSSESLFGILFLAFAFQTEWTAGVYVAALAQSSFMVLLIAILFMEKQYTRESHL